MEAIRTDHPQGDDRHWLGNIRARLGETREAITPSYHRAAVATRMPWPMATGLSRQG